MSQVKALISRLSDSHRFFNIRRDLSKIDISRKERFFSEGEERKISEEWCRLLSRGKVGYSKPLIAANIDDIDHHSDAINIPVYATDFMHYRATLDDPELRVWAVGVSGLTRISSSEGAFYIFGERNSRNIYTGGVLENLPGGFMEPHDLARQSPVESTYFSELEEETGIVNFGQTRISPLYVAQLRHDSKKDGRNYQDLCIELSVEIDNITPQDVLKLFNKGKEKREHSSLHIVPENDLVKFTKDNFDRFNIRARHTLQRELERRY